MTRETPIEGRRVVLRPGATPLGLALAIALGVVIPGCGEDDGDPLLIATTWPAAEREALALSFRRWAEATPGAASGPIRVRWIPLAPGDDPARVVGRRVPPDVLLGGDAALYRRLARAGRLLPVERTSHPGWCVSRRAPIGIAINPSPGASKVSSDLTFDDFRRDPVARAWASGALAAGPWAEGYARLVRAADHPGRIGRQPGSALADVERGAAAATPAAASGVAGLRFEAGPDAKGAEWVEGVAVPRDCRNPALAQEFLRFLDGEGRAASPPADVPEAVDVAGSLLADLLGATLVDARDELRAAWARLEAAGQPARAGRWMTEPPPWPPASITLMLARGEEGGALVETLTSEIAPEPDVRAWLLGSWLAPPRPIDGALLDDLAGAVHGRLARAPRFRAWLRGEWTAWARQRYRRVARLAGGAVP